VTGISKALVPFPTALKFWRLTPGRYMIGVFLEPGKIEMPPDWKHPGVNWHYHAPSTPVLHRLYRLCRESGKPSSQQWRYSNALCHSFFSLTRFFPPGWPML